jgi:serine/threonine protein kinase
MYFIFDVNLITLVVLVKKFRLGMAGIVFLARDTINLNEVCLKIISLNKKGSIYHENSRKNIRKKIKDWMTYSKKCIFLLSCKEIFEEENYLCIVMEYCGKGNTQDCINTGKIFNAHVFL